MLFEPLDRGRSVILSHCSLLSCYISVYMICLFLVSYNFVFLSIAPRHQLSLVFMSSLPFF